MGGRVRFLISKEEEKLKRKLKWKCLFHLFPAAQGKIFPVSLNRWAACTPDRIGWSTVYCIRWDSQYSDRCESLWIRCIGRGPWSQFLSCSGSLSSGTYHSWAESLWICRWSFRFWFDMCNFGDRRWRIPRCDFPRIHRQVSQVVVELSVEKSRVVHVYDGVGIVVQGVGVQGPYDVVQVDSVSWYRAWVCKGPMMSYRWIRCRGTERGCARALWCRTGGFGVVVQGVGVQGFYDVVQVDSVSWYRAWVCKGPMMSYRWIRCRGTGRGCARALWCRTGWFGVVVQGVGVQGPYDVVQVDSVSWYRAWVCKGPMMSYRWIRCRGTERGCARALWCRTGGFGVVVQSVGVQGPYDVVQVDSVSWYRAWVCKGPMMSYRWIRCRGTGRGCSRVLWCRTGGFGVVVQGVGVQGFHDVVQVESVSQYRT